jgi:hypothetical protein
MPLTYKTSNLTMSWCLDCHRNPAPNLRPRDRIFDLAWKSPADGGDLGKRLMQEYRVRTAGLTDCSTCHR